MIADLLIRETVPADKPWIKEFMDRDWGGEPLVVRGENFYPTALDGIVALDANDKVLGFLFYNIQGRDCEIIVFESFEKFKGIGTKVLNRLKEIAKNKNCNRIFLMTHNDNLDALRFYQTRGFHIFKIHINSMEAARKLKPAIALIGDYGIPIRDEIDLEMAL